jgi:Bacterial PH domain
MSVATTVSVQFTLDRGERQLWAGRPRQGLVIRAADAFMIPFSILWGGFAVFWEASVIRDGAPVFFMLWGVPFVLVGLYITIGRFFVDARRRARTVYAVTSDRILITSGILSTTTKTLDLRTLSEVTLQEGRGGSGTITFGRTYPFASTYAGSSWPGVPLPPSFEMIEGARQVYDIIREAQRASRHSGA